ncbi:conserved hypothetical protein [Francisella tularensis subsp. tularensis FSC033]|nr:conserved hypothetical protein [Francisella tularensis subsp. tularensis FSC033]EET19256.1 conserved hypothetical protein [Francisella tularensis subsp. tularensis MA00-2987]
MKNLVYTKNQSPLYKLNSKKKLATLLYTDITNIKKCLANPKRYINFEKPVANKVRSFEPPVGLNKKIHTRIFQLLTRIDDIPEYLHSGVKGRSYVTNAKQHQLSQYFLKMDIKDFYPSTGKDKVFLFFKKLDLVILIYTLIIYSVLMCRAESIEITGTRNWIRTSDPYHVKVVL